MSVSLPEQEHHFLSQDDVWGWRDMGACNAHDLDQWVKHNILHALEHCPRVMVEWLGRKPEPVRERKLCIYLARALENVLDDTQKASLLDGHRKDEASTALHSFVENDPHAWASLSPSWVGAPSTPLRQKALERGWAPSRLIVQVAHGLDSPQAQYWSQWVRYPHAMAVFQRESHLYVVDENKRLAPPHEMHTAQAWADPVDVALALHLLKELPASQGLNLRYTLDVQPNAPRVTPQEDERLRSLVQVHVGLGTVAQLRAQVLAGGPLVAAGEMQIALPEFGCTI